MNLKQRLATYKKQSTMYAKTWQQLAKGQYAKKCPYSIHDGQLIAYDRDDTPFNFVGTYSDLVRRSNHNGWYMDTSQYCLAYGVVFALRHKTQGIVYLAGYEESESSYINIDLSCYHDSEEDAARAGDRLAEIHAEKCRDADIEYQAKQRIEELKEEYHSLTRDLIDVIKSAKRASMEYPLCQFVKKSIKQGLKERSNLLNQIEKVKNDPYSYFSY